MRRLLSALAAFAPAALAQCVMCERTAAAQNAARIQVLNRGILLLGVPPFLILTGILLLAYKRREPSEKR
jgi:hypothetical protein